jgi:hypothetical protein
MGAPTEVYVDPAIAGNSGTGTIGDPYGDLQYALNTKVRDSTNGDRFNVKAGTAEVLAATLSFATYGTPTAAAPCIIQGYTSAANDGGIGEISGDATYKIMVLLQYCSIIDMKMGNCGSAQIISDGGDCSYVNCEFHTTTNTGYCVNPYRYCVVINCYLHDMEGTMLGVDNHSYAHYNTFLEGGKTSIAALKLNTNSEALGNIISVCSTANGIQCESNCKVLFNSIYGAASNGSGIIASGRAAVYLGNIIEGFSGSGGEGIYINDAYPVKHIGWNAFYNNATNINGTAYIDLGNNQTLSASPFVNAAGNDFRLVPGVLQRGGWPQATRKGLSLTDWNSFGAIAPLPSMRRARAVMIG